jgi:hypothetical protein
MEKLESWIIKIEKALEATIKYCMILAFIAIMALLIKGI